MLKKEPIRLCMACREKNFKKNLIRIVKEKSGFVFVDDSKKAQGRGAYLCSNEFCLKILQKKRCLEKSFKCKIKQDFYSDLKSRINGLK